MILNKDHKKNTKEVHNLYNYLTTKIPGRIRKGKRSQAFKNLRRILTISRTRWVIFEDTRYFLELSLENWKMVEALTCMRAVFGSVTDLQTVMSAPRC